MLTSWEQVTPQETIEEVLSKITHSLQWDFPVMDGDRLVGILPKDAIFGALRENPATIPVAEVMVRTFYCASEDSSLDELFVKMSQTHVTLVPVMKGTELRGLINPEQLGRFQVLRSAEMETKAAVNWSKVWEYHGKEKGEQ